MGKSCTSRTPHHQDYWSKKTAILIATLLTTNLLLVIVVMRLKVTYRERCAEQKVEHFTEDSPHNDMTESDLLNNTGPCRPCPRHWIQIENKCYLFSEKKKTKDSSEKFCIQKGGRLATVKQGLIQRLASTMDLEFWVGLSAFGSHYQEDSWIGVWTDGSIESVREGSGTCAKFSRRLILENCYKEMFWICEKDG
ncbi:C-type lectin domain family 12 member B-like isoform X3 [Bufo bufo]|uniref:C-type lectin domain family 12 member B-like isoform X2 n=1 Tax=Bufo bufo TaxID=8384 RepID=UPI001ABEAA87|nr:C-type lectin domain family 12 member B-like isoform X2 [Bufo bufo]XP_040276636.1 C-type lectin domain family 12 member B-like isoform X3 [Bufo bufo]